MKRLILIILFVILGIYLFSGCGIVQRTMHPTYYMQINYDCTRNISVFAPKGYKIYYSFNNGAAILDGVSDGYKHTIHIHKNYLAYTSESSWNIWSSDYATQILVNLGYEARKTGYTMISVYAISPGGYPTATQTYNLWGWESNGSFYYGNSVQDIPGVSSVRIETARDDVATKEYVYYFGYDDLSIEIQ